VPPVMKTGRGAMRAMSWCWSMGMSSQWPAYLRKLGAIQWYSLWPATLSMFWPMLWRKSAAPQVPEQLEKPMAQRGS